MSTFAFIVILVIGLVMHIQHVVVSLAHVSIHDRDRKCVYVRSTCLRNT